MQDALGRRIAIENPAHYLPLEGHTWDEIDFLVELARRTGCGLLLDVNNAYVNSVNVGLDAVAFINGLPASAVGEIHLAGHAENAQAIAPVGGDLDPS